MNLSPQQIKRESLFLLHCVFAFGAFFIPFLISWQITVPVLLITILQHIVFGRCLLLSKHGVSEDDGSTFFSDFFERLGFHPNKKIIRFIVRKFLYSILTILTIIWQVWLGHEPLWF